MRLTILALAVLTLSASGCASDDVNGMTFTFTERLSGEGPLGTCSFEAVDEPILQAKAKETAWTAGAAIGVVGNFDRSCGGLMGKPCEPLDPKDYSPFAVGAPAWSFEAVTTDPATGGLNGLYGPVAGILRASAPGTGGVGVHYRDETFGPVALQALAPKSLATARVMRWGGGKDGPVEQALLAQVAAGGEIVVLVRPLDATGGRLCGRAELSTAGTTGIAFSGDAALGAPHPAANSAFVLTFGTAPGKATLALDLLGAQASQSFDVVAASAIDVVAGASLKGGYLELATGAGGKPVAGALVHVENLEPKVKFRRALGSSAADLGTSFDTRDPAVAFTAEGVTQGRVRLSVPGSAIAPTELTFDVAP